jgi:hypothetical protein
MLRACRNSAASSEWVGRWQFASAPTSDRLPLWGNLAGAMDRFLTKERRNVLAMSWSLADPTRLEGLFSDAGFQNIRVEQIRREGSVSSFEDY